MFKRIPKQQKVSEAVGCCFLLCFLSMFVWIICGIVFLRDDFGVCPDSTMWIWSFILLFFLAIVWFHPILCASYTVFTNSQCNQCKIWSIILCLSVLLLIFGVHVLFMPGFTCVAMHKTYLWMWAQASFCILIAVICYSLYFLIVEIGSDESSESTIFSVTMDVGDEEDTAMELIGRNSYR